MLLYDLNFSFKPILNKICPVKIIIIILLLGDDAKINKESIAIGVARVGHDDQNMVAAPLKDLLNMDFGSPLHSLVIPGQLQILEQDAVNFLKLKK